MVMDQDHREYLAVSSWQVATRDEDVAIELFGASTDDPSSFASESLGIFVLPQWMGEVLANAVLSDIEFARRTRRDDNRHMVMGVPTGQIFCEPCHLEVDAPTMPAITRVVEPDDHERVIRCCVCKFEKRYTERGDTE